MADNNPSNRDVQRNVNRNTNEVGGSIRKLIQGVNPNVEGPHNPDGTYDTSVTKETTTTQKLTSLLQARQKQQIGVFQLISNGITLIKSLLTKLINKQTLQDTKPLLSLRLSKQFIETLVGKLSPKLLNSIKENQVNEFFKNIQTIANSLDSFPSVSLTGSLKDLNTNITSLNDNLTGKFIPSFTDIDVTSLIQDKLCGTFDVANALNQRLTGTFDVTSAINSRLTGTYDVTTGIASKISGGLSLPDFIDNRISGTYDLSASIDDKIVGIYDVGESLNSKIQGSFDLSKLNIADQVSGLFDTINSTIIDTFDTSSITLALQGKIKLIELKFNEFAVIDRGGILGTTQPKPEEGGEEGKGTPTGGEGKKEEGEGLGGNKGRRDLIISTIPYTNIDQLALFTKIETSTGKISNALSSFEQNEFKESDRAPIQNIKKSTASLDLKINGLLSGISDTLKKINNTLSSLSSIDKTLTSSKTDGDAKNEATIKQLLKINNSLNGENPETIKATIPGEKLGEEGKLVEVKVQDIADANVAARELAEFDVEGLLTEVKEQVTGAEIRTETLVETPPEKTEETKEKAKDLEKIQAINSKIDAYQESVIKYLDKIDKINGELGATFKELNLFNKLVDILKEEFKIDINDERTNDLEFVADLINKNEDLKNTDKSDKLADVFNQLNKINAFNSDKEKPVLNLKELSPEDRNKQLRASLLGIINRKNQSVNPLINKNVAPLKRVEFLKGKVNQSEGKIAQAAKTIAVAANKPLNFNLRNYLTSFGAYATLEEIIKGNVGSKLKSLGKSLSGLKLGGGEGELGGKLPLKLDFLKGGLGLKLKPFDFNKMKDFFGNVKDNLTKDIDFKNMKGKKTPSPKGDGGGSVAGTIGSAAGGAFVLATAATAGYGAYKAEDWDDLIGNTGNQSLLGTRTDGAFASLNHYMGEGVIDRTKTAIATGDARKLYGHNNLLDREFTAAEHKAAQSLGEDRAKQLRDERQDNELKKRVKAIDDNNIYKEALNKTQYLSRLLTKQRLHITGQQNSDLHDTTQNVNLTISQLSTAADTAKRDQALVKVQKKFTEQYANTYNNADFLQDLSKEDETVKENLDDFTTIYNELVHKQPRYKKFEEDDELPPPIRLQRRIWKKKDDTVNYLSSLSVQELELWKKQLLEFQSSGAWNDDNSYIKEMNAYVPQQKPGTLNQFKKSVLGTQNKALIETLTTYIETEKRRRENNRIQNYAAAERASRLQTAPKEVQVEGGMTGSVQQMTETAKESVTNTVKESTTSEAEQPATPTTQNSKQNPPIYAEEKKEEEPKKNNGAVVHVDEKTRDIPSFG